MRRHLIIDGVAIAVLCDRSSDALAEAAASLPQDSEPPMMFTSWEDMLMAAPDIDLVYISTDWASHAPIAIASMKAGYDVAVEVPAVTDEESAVALADTVRHTGRFFTMVENCCYDPFHLSSMALVGAGMLGEITHCEGAYIHHMCDDIASGWWQSALAGGSNPYPTHGLGPICQLLGIGRPDGDSLAEVVSMSPLARGINSSLISTRRGRTILLQYDVTTPRPYSRLQTVCGTRGYLSKYPLPVAMTAADSGPVTGEALDRLFAAHRHPLLEAYEADGLRLGVGNMMNYIMDRRLVDLVRNGGRPDITVDDAVVWSSLSWLTRRSASSGARPVAIPSSY